MSTKEELVEMIAVGTVVRPHPTLKGKTQEIAPGTRFSCDEDTAKQLESVTPLPAAKRYEPTAEAPSADVAEEKPAAKPKRKPAAKKAAATKEEAPAEVKSEEGSEGGEGEASEGGEDAAEDILG